jgi:zinc protease
MIKSATANLADDVDGILNAMSSMQSSAPASDQIETVKGKLIASMAERLSSAEGAADVILDIETYGLGRDYLVNFADRVNSITASDVQRAARSYLRPQSVTIVIAGPASRFESVMRKVGAVAVVKQSSPGNR